MKIKSNIKQEVQLQPEVLEEKIIEYLKKNYYRITDRGPGFVIFIDDEYSERKIARSDFHTRIGEGKFQFHVTQQGTFVKLIYLTPILYPLFLMTLFAAFGAYIKSFGPLLVSFACTLPVGYKFLYLNQRVFDDILEC
ncbi:MAG: hypothetical protein ABI113_02715 [Mucilaginibacter sp.]